ncbi:hypothetical protein GGTG_07246 [Gaeumannomyces tritici R3-111a-1]|uniref:NADH:flavin oxidoreductase/NADH oxidase N-terminal domain-containing protein n=1 Tax=Gaeumannomyces tritici (strain R3-111a-1) TaxID=644352 RepID=J3P149_GAET3|nr:hypothetical protein GGTG_07246 [Gaeumannomyces tritici R3-111a-1]EJT77334.1 hypothetical protein GGTG_07246 [Gaeumannomyces tritici R3-111a-1]
MTKLFTPLKVGSSRLLNRVAMAPMTRFRADDDWVPIPAVADYYAQRAAVPGTLLITEGTVVSAANMGMDNVPGIWTDAQVAAWRKVVDAVHARGGVIFCQLWAHGRSGTNDVAKKLGHVVLAPSAIAIPDEGRAEVPREMTEAEIRQAIADYALAARNAVERAGFDGVEIHGANGYLLDQFLQDMSNKRTDAWGGSVEKRARFHVEVVKAVIDAVGADRTGLRLSPYSDYQGMLMEDPKPQFSYLLEQLRPLKLAYLHALEERADVAGQSEKQLDPVKNLDWMVKQWDNASPFIVTGDQNAKIARETVDERFKDLDVIVGLGRPFITNPDVVFRFEKELPLELSDDRASFYEAKSLVGFADYPYSSEYQASVGAN